jgi:hypothetical protein
MKEIKGMKRGEEITKISRKQKVVLARRSDKVEIACARQAFKMSSKHRDGAHYFVESAEQFDI